VQPTSAETITSCTTAIFVEAGVTSPTVNSPFTVTLTDETPSTGQSTPNGLVDEAQGIHGHRIQKTIRMKIDIKDSTGSAPNYPVLVHLQLGGPFHGKLILDPDGNRVQCDQASFLWHERDANGNIIALNEEFEYQLGTFAPYVGTIPDSTNPSQLDPVWGTGEFLSLLIATVDNSGEVTVQANQGYDVHPQPGKPDHFSWSVPPPPTGTPQPIWTRWSDFGIGSGLITVNGRAGHGETSWEYNAYYLMDQFNNVTFGYTNLTQPPAPGPTLALNFLDQTSGTSQVSGVEVEPSGYAWEMSWNDNPAMPSGPYSSTMTLNYPTDPDWAAGSVSQAMSFQFDRGTFHFLVAIDGWDEVGGPIMTHEYDPPVPWTVSPGASGDAIPRALSNPDPLIGVPMTDPARLAILLGNGPSVAGGGLPVFNTTTTVETSDKPSFRVSLTDKNGKVATDGQFQIDLCPRYDHFPLNSGTQTTDYRPCSPSPIQSVNGVVSTVAVNNGSGGDNQGYMGIELVQAPGNPGTYYVKFEALSGNVIPYRIREEGDLVTDLSPAGEQVGGWALVTVVGGEFLDQSFRHIDPFEVDQDTTAYFRYVAERSETPPSTVTVESIATSDPTQTSSIAIGLPRIGQSSAYLGGPFTLHPPAAVAPAQAIQTSSVKATAAVLGVYAPQFELKGFFATKQVAQAEGLVNGLPIQVQLFYRGTGPPTPQTWTVLAPGDRAYLGDALQLTPSLPSGWGTPTGYGWSFQVDGSPYMPLGIDPNGQTVTIDPVKKAGRWTIKLRAFWGTTARDYERELEVWLETVPSATLAWIDSSQISPSLYSSSHISTICQAISETVSNITDYVLYQPGDPPPPPVCPPAGPGGAIWTSTDIARAIILLIKWSDNPTPVDSFASSAQVVSFLRTRNAEKFGGMLYSRFRVIDGVVQVDEQSVQHRLKKSIIGATEGAFPCDPSAGSIMLRGKEGDNNDTVLPLAGVDGDPIAHLTITRPNAAAQIPTFNCWAGHFFPWIWTKEIFRDDTPDLQTDKINYVDWCSNFPTAWGYTPSNFSSQNLRQFPIIHSRTNNQVPDPMSFFNSPNTP
jgi:hypothetical protein